LILTVHDLSNFIDKRFLQLRIWWRTPLKMWVLRTKMISLLEQMNEFVRSHELLVVRSFSFWIDWVSPVIDINNHKFEIGVCGDAAFG
jgi:hypothetical protein